MKTLSLSDVKTRLSGLVKSVRDMDQEIMITKNGSPAAVIISPDEYESWKETVAIRGDPTLMKEIKSGLKALKTGKARFYTIEELFK
jgi:antitoxin YefM